MGRIESNPVSQSRQQTLCPMGVRSKLRRHNQSATCGRMYVCMYVCMYVVAQFAWCVWQDVDIELLPIVNDNGLNSLLSCALGLFLCFRSIVRKTVTHGVAKPRLAP
eukprot:COSAG05_NODE_608_length_8372_cov_2.996615_5_plen_107_part_00